MVEEGKTKTEILTQFGVSGKTTAKSASNNLRPAYQNAVSWLKGEQTANGSWRNVRSTSLALQALLEAGENLDSKPVDKATIYLWG